MFFFLRFKQTQTKSKKDSKLDLFGFDDADVHQQENSGDNADGGSSYKIQYFGFDDMSDSDGADDEDGDGGAKERRRAKKAAAARRTMMVPEEETPSDEPPDPFERLESVERLQSLQRPTVKENKKNSERQESRIRAGKTHTHTHSISMIRLCAFS